MSRILLTGFFSLPAPSRVSVQIQHVIRALAANHEVDVLVTRHGREAYLDHIGHTRILRVPTPESDLRGRLQSFQRALERQLESGAYDVVHFRDGWSGSTVLEMRLKGGYITVFDAARAPIAEPPIMNISVAAELARSEEACLVGADHVLVPTEIARAHVAQRRSRGVHVVPPGVDVDLFDWDDPAPGPPLVVYAGAIEAGRGLRGLLRAMAALTTRCDARLLIAGRASSAMQASLEESIAELGLAERVELLGELPHHAVPSLLARATVCVAPAAAELRAQPMALYPTKLLEYMACRRAALAPRRGSATMLLDDRDDGQLFRPGAPKDLARKLHRLITDAELRARVADAGYRLVREHHTASATRRALRRAYATMQIRDTRPLPALDLGDDAPAPLADKTQVTARGDTSPTTEVTIVPGRSDTHEMLAVAVDSAPAGHDAEHDAAQTMPISVPPFETDEAPPSDAAAADKPTAPPPRPTPQGPTAELSAAPAEPDATKRDATKRDDTDADADDSAREPAALPAAADGASEDRDRRSVAGEVEVNPPPPRALRYPETPSSAQRAVSVEVTPDADT
ncbi:MAG: hypothetical protein Tsb0020_15410 [Haliangiales bacterium]